MVFTETWLNKNTFNTEILCSEFNIYRRDRETNTTGGGVLIAVSKIFLVTELMSEKYADIEFLGVRIKLENSLVFLTCSYIPPKSDQSIYFKHCEAIKATVLNAKPEDAIFVFGDFNLPQISWKFLPDSFVYTPLMPAAWIEEFLNKIFDLCLFQINGILNEYGNVLDLVFVDDPTNCALTRVLPITKPEDRCHPTLEVSSIFSSSVSRQANVKNELKFCFKKTNYNDLNWYIVNTNWLDLLSIQNGTSTSIDNMIETFNQAMQNYFKECVPKSAIRKHSGPPWSSNQLCRLKNRKNKHYKMYRKSGLNYDFYRYSVSRAEFNLLNKRLYANYLNRIKINFKRDPKSFYKFVNSKRKSTGYPGVMKYLDDESSDNMIISNMFADFFSTTYSKQQYNNAHTYPYPIVQQQSFLFPLISTSDIVYYIRTTKSSIYSGPDGIPACILTNCANALAIPLSIMFNVSLKYGYFPEVWKKSFIIPLFKAGSKLNVINYRGIAKLSAIPKLFERCLIDYLCRQISSWLTPLQHGFRKGCSTVTNVLQLTTLINRAFNEGKATDVVYTDFSKAFDKVNHNLLLAKLDLMGFSENMLCWIKSYLSSRTQCVCFNNSISKAILVNSGVPQGSHLGPLLFSLFINDLPHVIKFCNVLMYADDVKIFFSYKTSSDVIFMQQDLDCLYNWCRINLMELNFEKCKHMRFSRICDSLLRYWLGNHRLEMVEEFLDLGFLLDPKLDFRKHINMTVNKARGVLAFIKRWAKEFTDPNVTKQLYTSLVRPILEYGSVIWDPDFNTHIDRIESVQKQFLLFCLRASFRSYVNLPSYSTRLAIIKLPTLKSRRIMLNVTFVMKLINGDVISDFLLSNISFNIPQRFTRYFTPLYLPAFHTNYANSDPFRRLCRNFNEYYHLIDFSLNVFVIKRKIILSLNS